MSLTVKFEQNWSSCCCDLSRDKKATEQRKEGRTEGPTSSLLYIPQTQFWGL